MSEHIKRTIDEFIKKLPKDRTWSRAKDKVDWMLVTCIDYRYAHFIHEYMKTTYPDQLYDQLVLAGACLAATDSFTARDHWRKTFLEHIGLSIQLHGITGVLIFDHRTCGAYKEFKLLPETPTPVEELSKHIDVAKEATVLASLEFQHAKKPGIVHAYLLPKIAAGEGSSTDPVELLWEVEVTV